MSDYAGERLDQTPAKEVHSIARALTVLESLTKSDHDLGVSEIAKLTGLPVGTSHRILATLAYHGYVRQNDETRRYGPGMRLLGIAASAHERLGRTARSFLTQLMQASQETANLAILEGNSTLYIEQVPPPRMLRIFTEPGNRAFLHAAGTGKVLLAFQDQNVIDSIVERTGLPRLTPNTITEAAALLEVLERVRTQGYAIDLEEQEEGVCCLAAPVFTPDGALLAAMSVSGPAGRLGRGRLHDLVPHIKRVASALSRTINSIENRSPRAPVLGRDQVQGRSRLK